MARLMRKRLHRHTIEVKGPEVAKKNYLTW